MAKGFAIILVVLGHTIQNSNVNFDDAIGFRFIYSFHMPLFVFLAGAAASFWVSIITSPRNTVEFTYSFVKRICRSSIQLLLPFATWTVVAFIAHPNTETFPEYLKKVFLQPDYSLWFLPCIFWCIVYICIFYAALFAAKKTLYVARLQKLSEYLSTPFIQFILALLAWNWIRTKLPNEYGLVFVNWQSGGLFFYFLLGLFSLEGLAKLQNPWLRSLPYIAFALLAWFWHRTEPNNLISSAPEFLKNSWIFHYYVYMVAIAGALAFLDLSKIILAMNFKRVNTFMCLLGEASLGIYALHYYFISMQPKVIGAILISFIIYQLISITPFLRTIFLGR